MASETGHEPNRAYIGHDGNIYLNGCSVYESNGNDISSSLDVLDTIAPAELNFLDGVTAGVITAGKALVFGAGGDVVPATDDTGTFAIGSGSADIDFKVFLGATTQYVLCDVGNVLFTLNGVGMSAAGTITSRVFDIQPTLGSTTDGAIMRIGTGIGTSGLAFGTASTRAFALYLRPTATSGTFTGMRLRSIADPSSGSSLSIDNLHCQLSVIASKNAATVNCGFFEIIPKGTNTIGTARGLLVNVDSDASVTYTSLFGGHIRFHTRGDETITTDYMLYIENEAVGGNGREVDAGIYISDTNISGGIIGYTTGLSFAGSFQRCIDFNGTVGTTTDGALMRAGTGIGTSGLAFGTASQRAFAFYLRPTAASGTFTGMRLRSIADPSSGSSLSIDNLHAQLSVIASKDAATVNCGFFEIVPKGTNTIGTARCLLCNADSAASQTMTTQIIGHFRVHTRGDETITNDEMLRLENEAVGGNGRQLDSFIRFVPTSISGGIKAAAYMLDGGTDTSLLATAAFRFPDDGTVCHDTDPGAGNCDGTDFTGYITVIIGSATRYIPLISNVPSTQWT